MAASPSAQEPELSFLPLVLSLPSPAAYPATGNPAYFGETIGRVANRIAGARVQLNGTAYQLPVNNGPNCLHGGPKGWGKHTWSGPHPETRRGIQGVRFDLRSPDGDNGFPGTLLARAWYLASASNAGRDVTLELEYEVVWDPAGPETGAKGEPLAETLVNMTNHTAFSVAPIPKTEGQSRMLTGTRATLLTDRRLEVDEHAVPTGRITKHALVTVGEEIELGAAEPVFDDCFVAVPAGQEGSVPLDTRQGELRHLCSFTHPQTDVRFEAWSTEPAFQFYTQEFTDLSYTDESTGVEHRWDKRAGFCVEASRFVDAGNRPEWRGQVLLPRGETWGSRTVYKAFKK